MIWVEQIDEEKEDGGIEIYTQVVWPVSLKRKIRLVYLRDQRNPKKPAYALLFSTNLNQSAQEILEFYRLRYQIEFIFRDAKQFTGLSDCQARDEKALDFHFNASLMALNIAKGNSEIIGKSTNLYFIDGKYQTAGA